MVDQRRIASDLTVVIPTLGRDILTRSLEALECGTVWPARVIVVDQGRRSEIGALLERVKARSFDTLWLPSSQTGRASGVNRGVERATTRFVAITDDDCLVGADWVERLDRRLSECSDAIITGRVAGDSETVMFVLTDCEPSVQRWPRLRFDRLVGANMGIAKNLLDRLGGLDEDGCVRTAEDGEFAYRALRRGVPIVYAPELVVTHIGWRNELQRVEQYASYARSQGGFYGKYLRRGDLFIALRTAVHLLRAVRRWSIGVLTKEAEVARIGRAYVTGLIPGIVAGWRSGAAR
jgi:GT2 family glycosyltransferase